MAFRVGMLLVVRLCQQQDVAGRRTSLSATTRSFDRRRGRRLEEKSCAISKPAQPGKKDLLSFARARSFAIVFCGRW